MDQYSIMCHYYYPSYSQYLYSLFLVRCWKRRFSAVKQQCCDQTCLCDIVVMRFGPAAADSHSFCHHVNLQSARVVSAVEGVEDYRKREEIKRETKGITG